MPPDLRYDVNYESSILTPDPTVVCDDKGCEGLSGAEGLRQPLEVTRYATLAGFALRSFPHAAFFVS